MSFLLRCPNCGERDVGEFRFAGEVTRRPEASAGPPQWAGYVHFRRNVAGEQTEWWQHRLGCGKWFLAVRDTHNNLVIKTFWPGGIPQQPQAVESS